MKKNLHLVIWVILCPMMTFAATVSWTGLSDNNWHNSGNWDTNSVPTQNDDVIINVPGTTVSISQNAICNSIQMFDCTFFISGGFVFDNIGLVPSETYSFYAERSNITNFNSLIQNDGGMKLYDHSVISNDGDIHIQGNTDSIGPSLTLEYYSEILNNPGANIYSWFNIEPISGMHLDTFVFMTDSSYFDNYGNVLQFHNSNTNDYISTALYINNGSIFKNQNAGKLSAPSIKFQGIVVGNTGGSTYRDSEFLNAGIVEITGCTSCGICPTVGIDVQPGGKYTDITSAAPNYLLTFSNLDVNIQISGALAFAATLSFPFNLNPITFTPLTILLGNGPINNCCAMIQGTIAPGSSPGIITFMYPFSVTNPTTFQMELAQNGAPGAMDGHDQMIFQGASNDLTNVVLEVVLLDEYIPSVGDQFTLIDAGVNAINGTFSGLNLPGDASSWNVTYNANDVILELIAPITNINNIGFGTIDPKTKVHVKGGDIYLESPGSGLIMKDVNGACRKISIDAAGSISAPIVPCPN